MALPVKTVFQSLLPTLSKSCWKYRCLQKVTDYNENSNQIRF